MYNGLSQIYCIKPEEESISIQRLNHGLIKKIGMVHYIFLGITGFSFQTNPFLAGHNFCHLLMFLGSLYCKQYEPRVQFLLP